MPQRLTIDPQTASFDELAPAVRRLLDGGLVAAPTQSFYALMALVDQPRALEKIIALKGERERRGKPLLIMLDQAARVASYARDVPPAAESLMARFWPGPLTLLFPALKGLHPSLLGQAREVGLRLEGLPVIRRLARMADRGLTGTSANPGGAPPPVSAGQVRDYFGEEIDLILDGGSTPGGPASTVIDVGLDPPRVVRPGVLPAAELQAACPGLKLLPD